MPDLRPLVFAAALTAAGCSSTQSIASAPTDPPVVVDGRVDEWARGLVSVEGQDGLMMGVRNDEEGLYVALVVSDEGLVRQIQGGGLTLWVDPTGGDAKTFGVQFPLGRGDGPPSDGGREAFPAREGASTPPAAAPAFDRLAVRTGEDETGPAVSPDDVEGLDAAASVQFGQMTYEMRIPLRGRSLAMGATPGESIALGLETAEPERPESPPGGRVPGGAGGPGGTMMEPPSGGMGGPPPGGARGGPPQGGGADPLRV